MIRKPHTNHDDPKELYKIWGGDQLFKLGAWEVHAIIETPEIAEVWHYCNQKDKKGVCIEWSYQIPNDPHCPGCAAVQPDEIQGIVAMFNMDAPARILGKSMMDAVMNKIKEDISKNFMKQWKAMSVKDPLK